MTSRATLLEFLEQGGSEVWAYDMGRRIGKVSREELLAFERLSACWPFPVQQQAWMALVIRNDQLFGQKPLIWFVHFSLDETGHLVPAGRDYFLHRLFEAGAAEDKIGAKIGAKKLDVNDNDIQPASVDALKDNPQVFKPREDMMAVFHAQLCRVRP